MQRDIDPTRDHQIPGQRSDQRPDDGTPGGDPLPDPVGDLLGDVDLNAFTAIPSTIAPFGEAELRWQISAPDAVVVLLDGEPVGHRGTRTVRPDHTHTYTLAASAGRRSRQLGTARVAVQVEGSACANPGLPNNVLAAGVLSEVRSELEQNRRVTLRGDDGSAQVVDGGVNVQIPVKVDVPKWFDADTDLSLRFDVWTGSDDGRRTRAALGEVDVDVSWHFLEHAASLGCTNSVQDSLEWLLHALIQDLHGPAWARRLEAGIHQTFVANRIREAENDDEQGRSFALYQLELQEGDASVLIVCPL